MNNDLPTISKIWLWEETHEIILNASHGVSSFKMIAMKCLARRN